MKMPLLQGKRVEFLRDLTQIDVRIKQRKRPEQSRSDTSKRPPMKHTGGSKSEPLFVF